MFVAGVVGVVGTFYLMVLVENIQQNVALVVVAMLLLLFITLVLRRKNKQAIKRNSLRKAVQKAAQQTQ
jgi:LPXTG-motif cell wall-anchored protein